MNFPFSIFQFPIFHFNNQILEKWKMANEKWKMENYFFFPERTWFGFTLMDAANGRGLS